MFFVIHKKLIFQIIGGLSLACIAALATWGLQFSIEFTGGTIVEVSYEQAEGGVPDTSAIENDLRALDIGGFSLRASGEDGYILRTRDITEAEFTAVREALAQDATMTVDRRATVGPIIGAELKNKALFAIATVVVLIILYVAFAFRNVQVHRDDGVSEGPGVSSWAYGLIAIFVLVHDLLIPLGVFAVLGQFMGAEVDVLIVMALLTILGYSVNDTIVIFDRVRENLLKNREEEIEEDFATTVGTALSQTYARSINTSLTTLMVVVALLVLGGSTTTLFALILCIGVFAGTYSSLALAAPLLVTVAERASARKD